MRDTKFRGKSKSSGAWVCGDLINHRCGAKSICGQPARLGYGATEGFSVEVIPETIGQFTGLKDKNGVEIWEGDIVNFTYEDININLVVVWAQYLMMWKFAETIDGPLYMSSRTITNSDTLVVLSSIHDNPELLEIPKNNPTP